MPVIHRPPPDQGVQWADERPGGGALVGFDDPAPVPDQGRDALGRGLDEQLALVFPEMWPEEINTHGEVRPDRLLGRACQSTLPQERFHDRFDGVFEQFLGRAREDEIIGQADEVDLWTHLWLSVPDIARKRRP
jgi:hypothetical protein